MIDSVGLDIGYYSTNDITKIDKTSIKEIVITRYPCIMCDIHVVSFIDNCSKLIPAYRIPFFRKTHAFRMVEKFARNPSFKGRITTLNYEIETVSAKLVIMHVIYYFLAKSSKSFFAFK